MSSEHTYAIGDRVIVDAAVARATHLGVVYRVIRLLPVNVVVEPEGPLFDAGAVLTEDQVAAEP